eukprot:SAG25_NODE_316_length_9962_cov_5.659637_6_plen_247_part_00
MPRGSVSVSSSPPSSWGRRWGRRWRARTCSVAQLWIPILKSVGKSQSIQDFGSHTYVPEMVLARLVARRRRRLSGAHHSRGGGLRDDRARTAHSSHSVLDLGSEGDALREQEQSASRSRPHTWRDTGRVRQVGPAGRHWPGGRGATAQSRSVGQSASHARCAGHASAELSGARPAAASGGRAGRRCLCCRWAARSIPPPPPRRCSPQAGRQHAWAREGGPPPASPSHGEGRSCTSKRRPRRATWRS